MGDRELSISKYNNESTFVYRCACACVCVWWPQATIVYADNSAQRFLMTLQAFALGDGDKRSGIKSTLSSLSKKHKIILGAGFSLVLVGVILAAALSGGGSRPEIVTTGNSSSDAAASMGASLLESTGGPNDANNDVDVDCIETVSPCTAACETAAQRSYAVQVAAVAAGRACVGATNCGFGDGLCRETTSSSTTTTTHAKDCEYTVSACTAACEFGENRSITITQEPVGSTGKTCPTPQKLPDCEPYETLHTVPPTFRQLSRES